MLVSVAIYTLMWLKQYGQRIEWQVKKVKFNKI